MPSRGARASSAGDTTNPPLPDELPDLADLADLADPNLAEPIREGKGPSEPLRER